MGRESLTSEYGIPIIPRMSKKDWAAPLPQSDEITVHLKPFLGMRPGVYLTWLYAAAVVVILFFILFYPGLHARGAFLAVSTYPDKVTVKVDGLYAGSTPCTVFIKHGARTVELSKPYYSPITLKENVRGRVFATLLFPDTSRTSQRMSVSDLDGLLSWSLTDFQKNPEIPQIISDASRAVTDDSSHLKMYDFLDNCARYISPGSQYISSEAQLRELLIAASRASSLGGFLSPSSWVKLVEDSVHVKQKYDNAGSWLLLTLNRDKADKLAGSDWILQYLTNYREKMSKYYQGRFPPSVGAGGRLLVVQGASYRSVPSGELTMGRDDNLDSLGKMVDRLLPHPVAVESFYLGETEVTNREFAAFVAQNPQWSPANTAALVANGQANDSYLSDWVNARPPAGTEDLPVTSVSFFAATAYCDWLTRSVQAVLPGYVARLPYESEWEWAARGGLRGVPFPLGEKPGAAVFYHKGIVGPSRAGASEPNGYGLRDMAGNVWQWCLDPYAPSSYLVSSLDPALNASYEKAYAPGPDRVVRGGSWNNQSEQITVFTRGSQPAEWSTPYLGFRVAMARK
ncbi:MAG: SUMF1/EgtB/PvdO family nonheme iron enzyme [Spirochaetia bacterium]